MDILPQASAQEKTIASLRIGAKDAEIEQYLSDALNNENKLWLQKQYAIFESFRASSKKSVSY